MLGSLIERADLFVLLILRVHFFVFVLNWARSLLKLSVVLQATAHFALFGGGLADDFMLLVIRRYI